MRFSWSSGRIITVAETPTGTSGSSTDHSCGPRPGQAVHHAPAASIRKGPNGTHSSTG
ncbi:hypothetical protein GTY86_00210 [Streptomyces sp. SID5770]|uniref:hypothetical protein n=1 Tax=Streptomyces sp. SID5770 TaxID=2690308 RepID=UPI00136F32B6|nr:hypothetical protein [Streptomyces sp. SID5770]MZE49770.1 hypothetical protein [Streptomyces sp. SID5770]